MLKKDAIKIKEHFQKRISERYGINEDMNTLQKSFIKRLSYPYIERFNTKLIRVYPDLFKRAYSTQYQGIEVLFIYNIKLNICKTALSIKEI